MGGPGNLLERNQMLKSSPMIEAQTVPATVLNMALLDQYRLRKSNLLERLINAYLSEAPAFFQNIRTAAVNSDFDNLRMNAHALKSCSYNLGAVRLSKVCQELESAALSKDAELIEGSMTRIGPECFEAEQALRTELFQIKSLATPEKTMPAVNPDNEDWH